MTTDATSARPPLSERALSQRVRAVPPSGIRRFFDIIATMDDVISLGVGEPDFDTPREIVEAGVESLREGRTHYTSNFGTIELRRALAEHLRRRYGVTLRPGDGDPDHRRGLGGRGPRASGDLRPGRRGHPPRAVVRGLRPGDRVRRRHGRPGGDQVRRRLRPGPGGRRGRDHAADQGAVPGLPGEPHGRRPRRRRAGRAGPHRPRPRPARLQRRDLRPPRVRHVPPPRLQLAARHVGADDPDGRLLQGLRHDRLARGLGVRPGADPRGHRQGPPVRDHVRTDGGPGRGPGRAPRRRRRRGGDGRGVRPAPPAAGRRPQQARACRPSSPAARSTPSRTSPPPA